MNTRAFLHSMALAVVMIAGCAIATANIDYDPGWFWDDWDITGGPANTGYKVQLCHRCRSWRTVASGTTDSSGEASGIIIHWGPGDGYQPCDARVRVVFTGGGSQSGSFVSTWGTANENVACTIATHTAGVPGLSGPHTVAVAQNVPEYMARSGQATWFVDGSTFSLRLPEHFTFLQMPTVQATGPGDLLLGPPTLEEDGRALCVPVVGNARQEPTSGIEISDAVFAYDGTAPPDYYWPRIMALVDLAPGSDPFNPIEQAEATGHYRGIAVQTDPALYWLDETGAGTFTTFADVQAAYETWLGTPDRTVDFEDLPLGTKVTDQYEPLGIWFSGTDGGNYNEVTGVQQEGDPAIIENLTGYDGTYQPDGSQVYGRFQNTIENPHAPVTYRFDSVQRRVGGFIACGVQGVDHSFTVTAYDDYGQELGSRVYVAQIWESDPTGQNAETFFGIEAPFPCIRSVSVLNNSLVEFADSLIFDNVAWSTWPARLLGDYDNDGDVDRDDFDALAGCLSGPAEGEGYQQPSEACQAAFDTDGDCDIDLGDFAVFQEAFTGTLYAHAPFVPSPGQSHGERTGTVCTVAHQIYAHSGEFFEQRELLRLWGRSGLHWNLTVTYRSGLIYDGPLGKGWDLNQDVWLTELPLTGEVRVHTGYGREDVYHFVAPGQPYASPPGSYTVLQENAAGGHALTDRYGSVTRFDERGLAESITHRSGNRIVFERDPITLELLTVTDALSHVVTFGWNADGRLETVTDPEGREVRFAYDLSRRLETITLPPTPDQPDGSTTTFTYASGFADPCLNDNLLTIEDARGILMVNNTYDDQDRVITQCYGPPAAVSAIDYQPARTIVTDPDGFVVEYDVDGQGLPVQTTTHTHGIRPGDPPVFIWQQQHNADMELTLLTLPNGNSIAYIFDEANPDRLQRGNLLEVSNTSHLPGEPPLAYSYTYEPRFNLVKTLTDARGFTTTAYYDYEEATLGDLNGDGLTTQEGGQLVKVENPTASLGQPAPQPIVRLFWYNADGQCVRQIEPDGQTITYDYWTSGPGQGQLRTMVEDVGGLNLTTECGYSARGDVLWETEPQGTTFTYERDALGRITHLIKPAPFNYEEVYHYDEVGNRISEAVQNVDENGAHDPAMPWITTTFTRDEMNNITSRTDQVDGRSTVTTTYEYDTDGNLLAVTQPNGNTERWVVDERDLVYQHTCGFGSPVEGTETFNFDGNRNLIEQMTAEGNLHGYAYDGYDRQTRYIAPDGGYVLTEYEGFRLTSGITYLDATESTVAQRRFLYDEAGRPYQEDALHLNSHGAPVGDGWATMTWQRDAAGRPLVKTHDDGSQLLSAYDGAGRLIELSQPLSSGHENRTVFALDTMGNVLTQTKHLYNETTGADDIFVNTYEYDPLTRPIREVRGASGEEFIERRYNSRNLNTTTIDAAGTVIRSVYDGLDRETEMMVELPVPYTLHRTVWNDNSLPAEQYDANNNVTTFDYDERDRLTTTTYADGSQRTRGHDRDDRVVSVVNPTGTVETITPNWRGAPQDVVIAVGPDVSGDTHISYGYDTRNRLIWGQTEIGGLPTTTTEWHYDTMNNLDRQVQWIEGAPMPREVATTFDGSGNPMSLAYPSGLLLEYTMDEAHRLKEIRNGPYVLASLDYVGRKTSDRTYPNGVATNATFDDRFRMAALTHTGPGSDTLAEFQYAYNPAGWKKYEHCPHNLKGDAYHYNERGEFLGAKYGVPNLDPTLEYEDYNTYDGYTELSLDPQQNRVQEDENGVIIPYNSPSGPYEPDPLNRYYDVGGMMRTHDANGNLTYDGARTFTYNSRNRVLTVQPLGVNYVYDCIGRRVRADSPDGSRFLYYDREHCIEEWDQYGAPDTAYIWGYELDDLVAMQRMGIAYTCHQNDLGSVTLLTDPAGSPVEKIEYDAYGQPSFFMWDAGGETWDPTPLSVTGLPYLYMGQRYDERVGLYVGRSRAYDANTGRYLQVDPELSRDAQYNNRYSFADNTNNYTSAEDRSPYGTGGMIGTQSWTGGANYNIASEPIYEHAERTVADWDGPYGKENHFSMFKIPHVQVKPRKRGARSCNYGSAQLRGNNCNSTSGIWVQRVKNGNTVEIYVHLFFTINVNSSKVCTYYEERDPEIVKKRQRQGKPLRVHITQDFIVGHEDTHVTQMLDAFDAVLADMLKNGVNPKTSGFPRKIRKRLKEAYQQFKEDNARGYPSSPTEREARQKALEKWDRTQPQGHPGCDNPGAAGGRPGRG